MKTFKLEVDFHQGKTIQATAKTYPNLLRVIPETVQNSIDSGATRIEVKVHIPRRMFSVCDNGSGCGREKFQLTLRSLNSTLKAEDKYGQFGRGLVAPLSVADLLEFTSCPVPHKNQYCRYTFNMPVIIKQPKVIIPAEEVSNLTFDPDGSTWWRTKSEASKLTKDRRLTTLTIHQLVDEIGLKYGEAIRQRGILVSVWLTDSENQSKSLNVVAPEFGGKKLATFEKTGNDSGKVSLELYLAQRTRQGRKGKIVLGNMGNPSRISIKEFVESTRGLLDFATGSALSSGLFEGKILCEKTKLDPDRVRFEDNDALVELCGIIEDWFATEGKKIIEEIREQDTDNRYERLSLSIMPFAELMLRQDRFKLVAEDIKIGTIGKEHVEIPKSAILGDDPNGPSKAIISPKKPGSGVTKPVQPKDPKVEHPQHHPAIVYTGKGKLRKEVKGSTGLRFAFVEMVDTKVPFTYDHQKGILAFNLDHPDWGMCEDSDSTLTDYQMAVITTALSLELFRSNSGPHPETVEFAHKQLSEQAFAIMNGRAMLKK